MVPPDLHPPDPEFARDLSLGRLILAGRSVQLAGRSPFQVLEGGPDWQAQLHGFGWLRDLAAAGTSEAAEQARKLTRDWLTQIAHLPGITWQPDILANRILAWLSHSGFLLEASEPEFFRSVAVSLGCQIGALNAARRHTPAGQARLRCLLALVMADLTLAGRDLKLERSEANFLAELQHQILPDGGHVSRNADVVLALLLQLLPVRRCYTARERAVPAALTDAIDSMLTFLRAMRRTDGGLAQFNGAGARQADVLATVLAFDDGVEALPVELPASGYVRLACGQTVLLMDCGAPPPLEFSGSAQAGCLSFEMSYGTSVIFRNGGYPGAARASERPVARATASHNTLVLDNQSSGRLLTSRTIQKICGNAALVEPGTVTMRYSEVFGARAIEASHDGYARAHQLIHKRRFEMSADGSRLEAVDQLGPRSGVLRLGRDVPFAIHFHLAAGISAELNADRKSVTLAVPGEPGWQLAATGVDVLIESGNTFDDAAPSGHTGAQIVLRGTCPGEATVKWTLEMLAT